MPESVSKPAIVEARAAADARPLPSGLARAAALFPELVEAARARALPAQDVTPADRTGELASVFSPASDA